MQASVAPMTPPNRVFWACALLVVWGIAIAGLFVPNGDPMSASGVNSGDSAWVITASCLVLLMTPGLGFFYGGMVNHANIVSTILQSFTMMGTMSLLWVLIGFSIAFGPDLGRFIGNPGTYVLFHNVGGEPNADFAATIPWALYAAFQLKFAVITPALISGGLTERVRFSAFVAVTAAWTLVVYCPLAHWAWHPEGFLRHWGVLDFAGGLVVHMSSGFAALAGALVLRPRKNVTEKQPSPPSNIPLVLLGTGMLWFGWFGFNAGSALAANETAVMAFLTTNSASASCMLTWMFFDGVKGKRPSAIGACCGAVVGLVAITPAAGFVSIGRSIFIGALAAVVCNLSVSLRQRLEHRLDDSLDAFSCHGVGGMCGMLCTGFFADVGGVVAGTGKVFGYHVLATLIVGAWSFTLSLVLFKLADLTLGLRVTEEEERIGLDLSQHGEQYSLLAGIAREVNDNAAAAAATGVHADAEQPYEGHYGDAQAEYHHQQASVVDPRYKPDPAHAHQPEYSYQTREVSAEDAASQQHAGWYSQPEPHQGYQPQPPHYQPYITPQ